MALEMVTEKGAGEVSTITIGATKSSGGTRGKSITIGGQKALPFLFKDGLIPHKPVIAYEIWDVAPTDWPDDLKDVFGNVWKNPAAWAKMCVNELHAELLCLKTQGAHSDYGNKSAADEVAFIKEVLASVPVPVVIVGSGDDAKDNEILPACSEAAHGEKCLIGNALQDNYKTLVAAVMADGHNIIAESPIDINIAKQLNILISDMGLPLERIVINPTIGAMGYGLEYAYSIMERARLAGFAGDKTVASPFICFVGQESWKTKEAKASVSEFPSWGARMERGIVWEAMTSVALLQAGADILVMRHPAAVEKVSAYIDSLMENRE